VSCCLCSFSSFFQACFCVHTQNQTSRTVCALDGQACLAHAGVCACHRFTLKPSGIKHRHPPTPLRAVESNEVFFPQFEPNWCTSARQKRSHARYSQFAGAVSPQDLVVVTPQDLDANTNLAGAAAPPAAPLPVAGRHEMRAGSWMVAPLPSGLSGTEPDHGNHAAGHSWASCSWSFMGSVQPVIHGHHAACHSWASCSRSQASCLLKASLLGRCELRQCRSPSCCWRH